jgi:serine/threonine protein kinase
VPVLESSNVTTNEAAAPVSLAPREGTTSNKYTILGRLAGGGMADIFLARSTSIAGVERHVVLKRVLAELGRNPQFAKMFLDEARLAAQLQHPNIAQVHDVGILAGSYFFTMEYVHGKDIRGLLQRLSVEKRRLPLNFVLQIAIGALAALHHAHERTDAAGRSLGVVHRDVSPSNVMVSYEGAVKLLDFGVAKAAQRAEETRTGTLKGKVAYMSPEQCRSGSTDRRSDIFSLGIVLHELLTGRRLYRHDSDFTTMNAIVNDAVPPPSQFREMPETLDAVVLKALAKDPADRYATAAEMLDAIEEVAAQEHLVLSSTAMGRYLRELFGDRKEPWKEMPADEVTPMTITGESLAALDTPNPSELALAERLALAPPIERSEAETVSEIPAVQGTPSLPPAPRVGRNWPLIIAVSLAGVVAILLVALVASRRDTRAPKTAEPATRLASTAIDASGADAAAAAPAPDAPTPTAPTPVRTIAKAIADADWIGALQLCVATTSPSNDERVSCAIAACNVKQRGVALDYYETATAATRPAIERACRVAGIVLRQAPVATPQPPKKDPCEADPLQCQR